MLTKHVPCFSHFGLNRNEGHIIEHQGLILLLKTTIGETTVKNPTFTHYFFSWVHVYCGIGWKEAGKQCIWTYDVHLITWQCGLPRPFWSLDSNLCLVTSWAVNHRDVCHRNGSRVWIGKKGVFPVQSTKTKTINMARQAAIFVSLLVRRFNAKLLNAIPTYQRTLDKGQERHDPRWL